MQEHTRLYLQRIAQGDGNRYVYPESQPANRGGHTPQVAVLVVRLITMRYTFAPTGETGGHEHWTDRSEGYQ